MSCERHPPTPPQSLIAKHETFSHKLPLFYVDISLVFDVSKARGMYTGKSGYKVFAGKDASKALGKSSLKIEDCIADYSELTEDEVTLMRCGMHCLPFFKMIAQTFL